MNLRSAIAKVNAKGILLVFPIDNRKDPASLWSEFFPRKKMRWEWDESGDNRVGELWHLRERLSKSEQVVYAKWFRNRATLLSIKVFAALLKDLNSGFPDVEGLSHMARQVLEVLEEDSPIATKRLKKLLDLQGRDNESLYQRAMKELWERGLIVVFGEVEEGAFPSIAIGATRVIFESLWEEASQLDQEEIDQRLSEVLGSSPAYAKFYQTLKRRLKKAEARVDEEELLF